MDHRSPSGSLPTAGLYTVAASAAHARLYRAAGFVPAPEHGPLAVVCAARVTEIPLRNERWKQN